jgi:voltage-gated potassium channel
VVLGYTPGRTERIVDELLADGGGAVILASWDEVAVHPLPQQPVGFVRGDLTDDDVLARAAVSRAAAVLVDARDDNEALAMAVVVHHAAPRSHLVVALRDMSRARQLRYIRDDVCCVQWHSPRLITEELQDPGISDVYAELMTHGGGNTYSLCLPTDRTFGHCQLALGRHFQATVLAARTGDQVLVSPPWPTPLRVGTILYYVGRRRITPQQFERALLSPD